MEPTRSNSLPVRGRDSDMRDTIQTLPSMFRSNRHPSRPYDLSRCDGLDIHPLRSEHRGHFWEEGTWCSAQQTECVPRWPRGFRLASPLPDFLLCPTANSAMHDAHARECAAWIRVWVSATDPLTHARRSHFPLPHTMRILRSC